MKFLTDVNASGVLARWLLEHGYDVIRVADIDPSMEDFIVLQSSVFFPQPIRAADLAQDDRDLIDLGTHAEVYQVAGEFKPRLTKG